MPNCNLNIEFCRLDRTYASGEKISGWIRVNVDRNVPCRGLNLTARWETSGRGTPARGNYWQEMLYQGAWAPGQQYEYPFEIPSPGGPFSYHGKYLDLQHFISVRANLPWTIDARIEKSFQLVPGNLVESPWKNESAVQSSMARIPGKVAAIAFTAALVGGLVLLALGKWIGGIISAIAGAMALIAYRQKLLTWKLGQVHWDLPQAMSPGSQCHIRFRVGPVRMTKIRSIELRLQALELVCSGPQSRRRSLRHEIFSGNYPLVLEPAENESGTIGCAISVDVPDISAWTIDLPGNQVVWQFRLTIRQSWCPDWTQTRQIRLEPLPDYRVATNAATSNN